MIHYVGRLRSRESHLRIELKRDEYTRFWELEYDTVHSKMDFQLNWFLPAAKARFMEKDQLLEVVTIRDERQDECRIRITEVVQQTHVVRTQIPAKLVRRVRGHLNRTAFHENRRCG